VRSPKRSRIEIKGEKDAWIEREGERKRKTESERERKGVSHLQKKKKQNKKEHIIHYTHMHNTQTHILMHTHNTNTQHKHTHIHTHIQKHIHTYTREQRQHGGGGNGQDTPRGKREAFWPFQILNHRLQFRDFWTNSQPIKLQKKNICACGLKSVAENLKKRFFHYGPISCLTVIYTIFMLENDMMMSKNLLHGPTIRTQNTGTNRTNWLNFPEIFPEI